MWQWLSKMKPYVNYMGVSESKHKLILSEIATPVAEEEVSELQQGVSLSTDTTFRAIHLISSTGKAANMTKKVAVR